MSDNKRDFKIFIKKEKKFVSVTKEIYCNFYRKSWAQMRQLQRSGECSCPKSKIGFCDGDCWECEFYCPNICSLDQPLDSNEDCCLIDNIADTTSISLIYEQSEFEKELASVINNLPPDEKIICLALMNGWSNRKTMTLLNYKSDESNFRKYKARRIASLQKKLTQFKYFLK